MPENSLINALCFAGEIEKENLKISNESPVNFDHSRDQEVACFYIYAKDTYKMHLILYFLGKRFDSLPLKDFTGKLARYLQSNCFYLVSQAEEMKDLPQYCEYGHFDPNGNFTYSMFTEDPDSELW